MSYTPVEIRHVNLKRGLIGGYRLSQVDRLLEEITESFETVWRERADFGDRVELLEDELKRYRDLENLLRTTLVSAERAAQDMKEQARREADVIVQEAGAEGRRLVRDAIVEKEQLLAETRRVRSIMRSALDVLAEDDGDEEQPSEDVKRSAPITPRLSEQPAGQAADRLAG